MLCCWWFPRRINLQIVTVIGVLVTYPFIGYISLSHFPLLYRSFSPSPKPNLSLGFLLLKIPNKKTVLSSGNILLIFAPTLNKGTFKGNYTMPFHGNRRKERRQVKTKTKNISFLAQRNPHSCQMQASDESEKKKYSTKMLCFL